MNLRETAAGFDNLDLLATQVVEGFITGMHKSPFHGFSVEFAEHRLYNTGESTRNIDWKLFGRTDKLFVKRYDEETNLRCHLLLDVSASMYYPEGSNLKIRFAALAVAVLANILKKQRDAFALSTFSSSIGVQTDVRSSAAHYRLILQELQHILENRPMPGQTDVAATLDLLAEKIHRRSLVIVLSDMFDSAADPAALFGALQHLKFKKHEVIVFHITDATTEDDFNFDNRPYRFVDSETSEEIKVYPDDVRRQYLDNMNRFRQELKLKCNQYRIDLVEVDAADDFSQILLPFFVKRKKMSQ